MAAGLQGSEIIKLAGQIKEKMAAGQEIFNFTIGDFDPAVFPIPEGLHKAIVGAYEAGHTNYPPSNGMQGLREVLSAFISRTTALNYPPSEFLVAGGGRPLIYCFYQAVVNPGEKVIFPVPSWNNNHYTHLSGGLAQPVVTQAHNHFMPTAADLAPHLDQAAVVALCSPLNPTGTVFTAEGLKEICDLILAENEKRAGKRKPLYLLYDQIYWQLTFGDTRHVDPVSVQPGMRPYTLYIDGASKAYAATGLRVGWAFGPDPLIRKMKSLLGHIGAWAPKPEQIGVTHFLEATEAHDGYMEAMRERLHSRLRAYYDGFRAMADAGLPVDAIAPQAAMYLTVKIDLKGRRRANGTAITTQADVTSYLLDEAGLAVVPFGAFGAPDDTPWYRLSVGTAKTKDIPLALGKLRTAIDKLT